MDFELTNQQRLYFGLEPIDPSWERVLVNGGPYRPSSVLYFDGDIIKREIIATESEFHRYFERHFNEPTRARNTLLPITTRGKEVKLTAATLENRRPHGMYFSIDANEHLFIANYDNQQTFYSSRWERDSSRSGKPVHEIVEQFISAVPDNYLNEIDAFKIKKKKHVKFSAGDFFSFKISLTKYGFGRILLDVARLRGQKVLPENHMLNYIMAKPVLVKIYQYTSESKAIDIGELEKMPSLPSDYMMDNHLFYGEYEIIGHNELRDADFDFPMSYGRHIHSSLRGNVYFQWGAIYINKPANQFDKYLLAVNPLVPENSPSRVNTDPYRYSGIGFNPKYGALELNAMTKNNGAFNAFERTSFFTMFDLRNPENHGIRNEIMLAFGLDPAKDYTANCELANAQSLQLLIKSFSRK